MHTFTLLQLLSWLAVGAIMYLMVATMGFDLGGGMLARFVGRTDDERRVIINTFAPTWDGNQVWFITLGGAIFAIFPRVYAASFSGLYLGILLVLWGLFLRPVAFEYRSKLTSTKWRHTWDWLLMLGSFIPSLVAGVAVGNIFLGFPFQFDPETLRFFYGSQQLGVMEPAVISLLKLLMPFALFMGIFAVIMFLMHGASYGAMRTSDAVCQRFIRVQKTCAVLFILLFAIGGIWLAVMPGYHWLGSQSWASFSQALNQPLSGATVSVTKGGWLSNYAQYPWMIIAPILGFVGAILLIVFATKRKLGRAFCASLLALFGAISTMGLSLFPFLMPSSVSPAQSLVVWNASSSEISLWGILIVALIFLPIIFIYTTFVYKKMWGRDARMTVAEVQQRTHELY